MSKITSCPVCRGEIHAIAGRCKHCKADLVELREHAARIARAQAIGATVPPPRFGLFAHGARPMTAPTQPAPHPLAPPHPPPGFGQGPHATEPAFQQPPFQQPTLQQPQYQQPTLQQIDHDEHGPGREPTTAELEAAAEPYLFPQDRQVPVLGPPPGGTPPYGLGFAGARARRASTWSRRWPLVVSAVALLAIGISIGVLAERWRQKRDRPTVGAARHSELSRSPVMVPDHMPQPLMPGPQAPRVAPDPAPSPAPRADDPPDSTPPDSTPPDPIPPEPPDSTPADPPSNPGSRFSPPPADPGDSTGFRTFSAALTESLCQKLTQCGVLDSTSQSMCRVFAQEMDPDDAAEKVARGECSFNQKAADACLQAVADLSCDVGAGDRMMEWLMARNRVGQCAEAYVCP